MYTETLNYDAEFDFMQSTEMLTCHYKGSLTYASKLISKVRSLQCANSL